MIAETDGSRYVREGEGLVYIYIYINHLIIFTTVAATSSLLLLFFFFLSFSNISSAGFTFVREKPSPAFLVVFTIVPRSESDARCRTATVPLRTKRVSL